MRTSGSSSAHEGSATLRDYLHVARRRKWIIVQATVLVPLATVLFSLHQTPVYQASASVLLSRENLANTLTGAQDPSVYTQADRIAQTQADLARVPEIARRVIAQLGLQSVTPQGFLSQSSVSAGNNADLLSFNVQSTDSKLAASEAAAYAEQYTRYRRQLDTAPLESARKEVQGLIDQLAANGQAKGALYASLVEKEQQLRTMEALQTSNANVVQIPTGSSQISPRPVRDGALGLMLGIVLGIGLAFLREALDTRVRSAQEIGDRLELPLLARIPEPPKKLRSTDKLVMLAEPSGVHA